MSKATLTLAAGLATIGLALAPAAANAKTRASDSQARYTPAATQAAQSQPGEGRSIAAYLLRAQYTDDQRAPGSGVGFAFYNGKFNSAKDLAEAKPSFEGELPQIDLQKMVWRIVGCNCLRSLTQTDVVFLRGHNEPDIFAVGQNVPGCPVVLFSAASN